MSVDRLEKMRELIQEDVGRRGLRTDPVSNLITACPDDFGLACRGLAATEAPSLAIVTGFFIPQAEPPCGETDGPLGALFLARALSPLGFKIALVTDDFCRRPLEIGLQQCGLEKSVPLIILPTEGGQWESFLRDCWQAFLSTSLLTHLIALERVGPSHTPESIQAQKAATATTLEQFTREVPPEHHDRCHTMRGLDITERMSPAHLLFEVTRWITPSVRTIGIGDGGNEIGMGKISWDVIRRNIPGGGLVACRVATDYLIVSGISNWGAYGLATGVRRLRGAAGDERLFDPDAERELLAAMVEGGPLVDGVLCRPSVTVDGLDFDQYGEVLRQLSEIGGTEHATA